MSVGQIEQVSVDPVSSLRERHQARLQENWSAYRDLLGSLAGGESVDPIEIELTLKMVGKDVSDIERDLPILKKRIAAAAKLAEGPRLAAESSRLEREYQAKSRERHETVQRLDRELDAARHTYMTAAHASAGIVWQEAELRRSVLDPNLIARESRLNAAAKSLIEPIRIAEEDLRKERAALALVEDALARNPTDTSLAAAVASRRESVAAVERELEPLQRRLDAIQSEVAEVVQQKLTP